MAIHYGVVPMIDEPDNDFDPVFERNWRGATQTVRLPFSIVVLADLGTPGQGKGLPPVRSRRLVSLDLENVDSVLARLTPEISFQVPDLLNGHGNIPCHLRFRSVDDFDIYSIIRQVDALKFFAEKNHDNETIKTQSTTGMGGRIENDSSRTFRLQLNSVISHPEFQRAANAWNALYNLLHTVEEQKRAELCALNITKKELFRDLTKAVEFDQSFIFKKLYDERIGTPGGAPIGLVIADFPFTAHPEDVELLSKLSSVCEAGHMVLLAEASHDLLFLNAWDDLDPDFDPDWLDVCSQHGKYRILRLSGGRLALLAPGLRYRVPAAPAGTPECGSTPWLSSFVQTLEREIRVNPAYLVAAKTIRQFQECGRFSSLGGALIWRHFLHNNDGAVSDGDQTAPDTLPLEAEATFDLTIAKKLERLGVNAVITDRQLGSVRVSALKMARAFPGQLAHMSSGEGQSVDLGAQLHADRVMHYFQTFARDHVWHLPFQRGQKRLAEYVARYFAVAEDAEHQNGRFRLGHAFVEREPIEPGSEHIRCRYILALDNTTDDFSRSIQIDASTRPGHRDAAHYRYRRPETEHLLILTVGHFSNSVEIKKIQERSIMQLDYDNINDIVRRLMAPEMWMNEPIAEVEDFLPERFAWRVKSTNAILAQRQLLSDLGALANVDAGQRNALERFARWTDGPLSLSDLVVASEHLDAMAGEAPIDPSIVHEAMGGRWWHRLVDTNELLGMLTTLSNSVRARSACVRESWLATLRCLLASVDKDVSRMVEPLVDTPTFRSLQSNWYGVRFLTDATKLNRTTNRFLLAATETEIGDLERYSGDLCELISKRYSYPARKGDAKRNTYLIRGTPSHIIFDVEVKPNDNGLKTLRLLAEMGEKLSTRMLVGASPWFLGLSRWDKIAGGRGRTVGFDPDAVALWRRFRRRNPHAERVTMVLPPFLSERGASPNPSLATFRYRDGEDASTRRPVRSSGAYVYAAEMALAHDLAWIPEERNAHFKHVTAVERDAGTLFGPILPALIDGLDPQLRHEGIVWPVRAGPPYFLDDDVVSSALPEKGRSHGETG